MALRNVKKCGIHILFVFLLMFAKPSSLFSETKREFFLSVYPLFGLPIIKPQTEFTIQTVAGGGATFHFRPFKELDVSLDARFSSLSLPNVKAITLLNASLGAGYLFPLSERLSLGAGASLGVYRASHADGKLAGLSAGVTFSLSYRINPIFYAEGAVSAHHFTASPQPLLTDAEGAALLTINVTELFSGTANVLISAMDIEPVFPVLYSWYKENAFGKVVLKNEEDSVITNVSVSFFQSQYMSQPNVCNYWDAIASGETVETKLTAFFNERMLDLLEKTDTEARVIVEYSYLGQRRKKEITFTLPVYGRNSMSWDDDKRAAVFVSSRDPAAQLFAKHVASIVNENARPGISKNIQYAMGIFESFNTFGIHYVIDPASAYADNVGSTSIDFLQFPYQTLSYRGGDCDDLSILTCALFEAVGIRTAFITIPGHIYMAFDSGLSVRDAGINAIEESEIIDYNGEAWIPLEITISDEGFSRAWRVGAREWKAACATGDEAFYPMKESWRTYQPVSIPGAAAHFTLPQKDAVLLAFDASIEKLILREIAPLVLAYQGGLDNGEDPALRNAFGVLYARYGLFDKAVEQFVRSGDHYLPSLINRGNVAYSKTEYREALSFYKKVLEKDSDNLFALLGVSRAYYELKDFASCDAAYAHLKAISPELAAEYGYLRAFEVGTGRSYSLSDRLASLKWSDGDETPHNYNTDSNFYTGLYDELTIQGYGDEREAILAFLLPQGRKWELVKEGTLLQETEDIPLELIDDDLFY